MTQEQIDKKSPREYDLQLRRHLIASLRIVETRLNMDSSLRAEIGQRKESV